jgi:GTP-binding protein EngB required for normal cell division
MFMLQKAILAAETTCLDWWKQYGLPTEALQAVLQQNQSFVMRVPLIGAFSAGKSTLINSLLKDKLLAVDIDPASSLPIELYYAEQEHIIGHPAHGQPIQLSRDALKNQDFDALLPDGWVELRLHASILQPLTHLCLVDMPGLDSKNTQHEQAINHYIGRSLAYCLVISADAGTLQASTRNFLQELALHQAPVLVVVTKADKKNPEDLQAVIAQVTQHVRELLGDQAWLEVVSASRKDTTAFAAALLHLEAMTEQRFRDTVGQQALHALAQLNHKLTQLIQSDDLNQEQLQEQREQHTEDMRAYQQTFLHETQQLEGRLNIVVQQVISRIDNALRSQLDTLARAVANGSDVSASISQTVRLSLIEGIQQDFSPLVQQYQTRIEAALPDEIHVPNHFCYEPDPQLEITPLLNGAMSIMSLALKRFPVVAVLAPLITTLIEHLMSQRASDAAREQRREQACDHVLNTMIPQVMQQVRTRVTDCIRGQVEHVKTQLQQQAAEQHQIHQATLQQLDAQLQQGHAAFAEAQAGYQLDQQQVGQLITQWQSL